MSNYDTQVLINHLKEKWQGRGCSQCGSRGWEIQGSVYELRQYSQGTLVIGGAIIPVVPVTCANCGNTVLVNALSAGAVERPEEAKK
jgi:hypothetical protein